MKTRLLIARFAPLLALILASTAPAAYLDSDAGKTESLSPPRPPPAEDVTPVRPRDNPLVDLVRRLDIGAPYSCRGLTVFPLLLRGRASGLDVLPLDEALARRDLVIREKDEGQVPYVQVRNDGSLPVFLMAGEIIVGGRQNRLIRDDALLPSRSGTIDVPVYCGEQNRWQSGGASFKSGSSLGAPAMREMAAAGESQDRIWREIDGTLSKAAVKSETKSYQAYFDDAQVKRRLDDCVSGLRACRTRGTVGLVAVGGNRILGCDLFADPDLCARLWDKIIRSYGGEIAIQPKYSEDEAQREKWAPGIGAGDIQRLLDRVRAADFEPRDTVGFGRLYRLRGGVAGNVLVQGGDVVHAAVFAAGTYKE